MAWPTKAVIQNIAAAIISLLPFSSIAASSTIALPTLTELRSRLADVDKLEPSMHVDLAREQLKLCIKTWGERHVETISCRVDLGEAQLAEMFFADAEVTLRAAVAALEATAPTANKTDSLARGQSLLGAVLGQQSKYDEARALLDKALASQQSPSIERFRTLARLSQIFAEMLLKDEFRQTAAAMRVVAALHTKMSVTDRALLAAIEARLVCAGNNDKACALQWEFVLALMQTAYSKNDSRLTLALERLASAYNNKSRDRERSEAVSEQMLQIERVRPRQNARRLGSALADLGGLYNNSNRFALAEQVQRQAVALAENDPSAKLPLAMRLSNLGETLINQGRLKDAEPLLRQSTALTVSIFGNDNPNSAFPRQSLAEVLGSTGRRSEAIALNAENIRILKLAFGQNHNRTLFAMHYQGSFLLGNKQAVEAKIMLSDAMGSARDTFGPTAEDTLNIQTTYAQALFETGDASGALREARLVLSEVRAEAIGGVTRIRSKSAPADRFAITFNAAKRLRNVLFRIAMTNDSAIPDAFFIQQFIERNLDGTAAWRTGARLAAQDAVLRRLADDQQVGIASLVKLRNQLATAYRTKNVGDINRLSAALDVDRTSLASTTASIDARYPAFANLAGGNDLPIQQLTAPDSNLLKSGDAALFLIQDQDDHYALLVKRGFRQLAIVEINAVAMVALVTKLRKGIAIAGAVTASDLPKFDLDASHALYQKLMAPFEPHLRGVRKLYLSVDGPLASLPLSLLVTKLPGRTDNDYMAYRRASWFGDRHTIVTLPAINALQALRRVVPPSKADRPLLAVADPALNGSNGGNGSNAGQSLDTFASLRSAQTGASMPSRTASAVCALRSLPDTRREAEAMAKAMNAPAEALLFGSTASESTLVERSQSGELRRYRALLFATHGLVAGSNPSEEPAIVLTPNGGCGATFAASIPEADDGLLTASEIATLSLDADAVILSGCNTAASDGSGSARPLSGLARAFLYAGARQIIVSHWSVDSAATAELMAVMASNQIKGQSYASALQAAMRKVRNNPKAPYRAHPAFWAAFTAVGDGR